MFRTPLYYIAGIDRETLATCPATDKMWASHLGLSLALSFTVVLGITFHASGYVLADTWMRLLVATVVALTVFMFDRALYQSDWFYQGLLRLPAVAGDHAGRAGFWQPLRRFSRIAVRLSISFGLAWVIAVFLELAVFSDTITDKIKRDHLAANQPIFQKIEHYEAQLNSEIEQRQRDLAELERLYGRELTAAAAAGPSDDFGQRLRALDEHIDSLDAQEQRLRTELRDVDAKIAGHAEAMNAEELGQRINPDSSGRAGAGPRYLFARRQKEFYEARRADLQNEVSQLGTKREDLRTQQRRLLEQGSTQRDQARDAAQNRRNALRAQIEVARTELRALEASRLANIEDFRRKALAASDFQKQKDDPLSRMTAYQELKNDPKDGATITLFSWMTKFLVIFLEIVPVVAKMFFSPPSVYAVKIQAQVERERRKAILENQQMPAEPSDEDGRLRDSQIRIDRQVEEDEGLLPQQAQAARRFVDDMRPQPQQALVDRQQADDNRTRPRQALVEKQTEETRRPQPGQALIDGQSENETRPPAAKPQPKPDAVPSAREDRDAEVYVTAAGLGGLIATAAGSRIVDFAESSPCDIPEQSEPLTFARQEAAARVPEVDGPSFDAIDPQLQYEWEDLMEAAERGDFGTPDESKQLAPDMDEHEEISPMRRG
jgi:hypothetical protein